MVVGALGWLAFGFAGGHAGQREFPDADGSTVEILDDPGARMGMAEAEASAWRPWNGRGYIRAAGGDAVWLRVTLRNPGDAPRHAVLADTGYFPDRVDLWGKRDGRTEKVGSSGEALAGREKPLWGRLAAFTVDVPARGKNVVWLRAVDAEGVYLRPAWWPQAGDFWAIQIRDVLVECLCYGALVALLLYNLVLWLRLRFPDTGSYVLYAGATFCFNFIANGGLALLGWPAGSPAKEMLVAGSLALSGFFLVRFARVFLGTAALLPRADRALRGLQGAAAALAAGVALMPRLGCAAWLGATIVTIALTHALLLAVALGAWRAGARHARFFIAAFGLLFAGALPAILTWLNNDVQAGAALALLAGSSLEMLMLAFAMADRFAQTQRRLVEETEQRRMIEETYAAELEIEVRERTRELEDANTDKDRMLMVIGHDLRGPLTGLMRAADATVGPFAREMSRAGREILLMIEDLVLWARMRAGTRVLAVHPAPAVLTPAILLHQTLADHGGLALEARAPEELRVVTDLVLAQTLVRNLLANALKFAQARVTLRAEPAADGVRFTVGNDGPPLPPEVAARFSAGEDPPLSATGGLGLRLCREICRALGGRLEAGTAADGATEFCFTLPAAPSPLR